MVFWRQNPLQRTDIFTFINTRTAKTNYLETHFLSRQRTETTKTHIATVG